MLNLACLYAAAPSLTLTSLAFSAGGVCGGSVPMLHESRLTCLPDTLLFCVLTVLILIYVGEGFSSGAAWDGMM